jgi:hypothetical protein
MYAADAYDFHRSYLRSIYLTGEFHPGKEVMCRKQIDPASPGPAIRARGQMRFAGITSFLEEVVP